MLNLRYQLSAHAADQYCAAGFTTIVQDNIYGHDVTAWLGQVHTRPRHLLVLTPSPTVVAARDAARHAQTGKLAYRPGEFTIHGLDTDLRATPRLGLWLDTSDQTPDQTVQQVLRRRGEARIDPTP